VVSQITGGEKPTPGQGAETVLYATLRWRILLLSRNKIKKDLTPKERQKHPRPPPTFEQKQEHSPIESERLGWDCNGQRTMLVQEAGHE
jgi:hypothetical protein